MFDIKQTCTYHPNKKCDLCADCLEIPEQKELSYLAEYEPSDEDIEQMIEELMLAEELKADNI